MKKGGIERRVVSIKAAGVVLEGDLALPSEAQALICLVHGTGSDRNDPRNAYVAHYLEEQGFATLLIDLMTERERSERQAGGVKIEVGILGARLVIAIDWLKGRKELASLQIGCFGARTGAAAALLAAARRPDKVHAVVSRGGRPDLAGAAIYNVRCPVLLLVGGRDFSVLDVNCAVVEKIPGEKFLQIIPEATHLFTEPGTLEKVAKFSVKWFRTHLAKSAETVLAR